MGIRTEVAYWEICLARKEISILKTSPDLSADSCKKSRLRRKYHVNQGTMP